MSPESADDLTAPHGCAEGIALVLRAQDHGEWQPLAEWLARHPRCAEAVARFMAADHAIDGVVNPPAEPARAGTVLGDYELLEEIGRGAMGVVYRAIDRRIRHEVAVKVVTTAGLSPAELARVRFEAEAMAALSHPNVVSLFAYGETDTELYFAMALMTGSLAGRLKELGPDRRYSADDAAKLVGAIARGVHHAHQRLLIHRDLKPGNVLLDKEGVPKIADFGLARRVDVTASIAGGIAGTFAYMAPEQACGDKQLTTAVDVHALGAILFELLTGKVPYRGDAASVLRKLIDPHERAPAVSAYRPDVPADLEAICQKCLERDPSHRYASAQELADDLERFLRREPVLVRPRGLLGTVKDALTSPAEVQSFSALPAVWFATVHHPVVHLTIMALVLAGAPVWAFGVMMYHLAAWLGQTWWFHLRKFGRLNQAERKAAVFNLGNCLAVMTLVPVVLTFCGPDAMPFYPALTVATGIGFFQTGSIFAGRQYVLALLVLGLNLFLPLLPLWAWPLLHALTGFVFFSLFGLHVRRVHRAAEAARARLETAAPG